MPGIETIADSEEQKWVALGIDGGRVRRYDQYGSRFDAGAAAETESSPSPKAVFDSAKLPRDQTWYPLTEESQYEEYHMSIVGTFIQLTPSYSHRLIGFHV